MVPPPASRVRKVWAKRTHRDYLSALAEPLQQAVDQEVSQ